MFISVLQCLLRKHVVREFQLDRDCTVLSEYFTEPGDDLDIIINIWRASVTVKRLYLPGA